MCGVQVIITHVCIVIFLIKDMPFNVAIGIEANTVTWTGLIHAKEYLVRVSVKDFKEPITLIGKRGSNTLEILHSTLKDKTSKSLPDPVTVDVTVLAIGEKEVLGIESLFNIGKYFYIKT